MKEGNWEQSAWILLVVAVLLMVAPFLQNQPAENGEEVVCTCVPLAAPLAKRKSTSFYHENTSFHLKSPRATCQEDVKPLLDPIICGFLQIIVHLVLVFPGS